MNVVCCLVASICCSCWYIHGCSSTRDGNSLHHSSRDSGVIKQMIYDATGVASQKRVTACAQL